MIQLGQKVRDRISGFEGIAIGRTEWLHGCQRVTIQPTALHEGKPIECQTFDEAQVEVTDPISMFPRVEKVDTAGRKLGPAGPKPTPSRHSTPSRR